MQTNIIKWDESMAMRCLARSSGGIAQTPHYSWEANNRRLVRAEAPPEEAVSIDIAAEEWDDFQYTLGSIIKKKNK